MHQANMRFGGIVHGTTSSPDMGTAKRWSCGGGLGTSSNMYRSNVISTATPGSSSPVQLSIPHSSTGVGSAAQKGTRRWEHEVPVDEKKCKGLLDLPGSPSSPVLVGSVGPPPVGVLGPAKPFSDNGFKNSSCICASASAKSGRFNFDRPYDYMTEQQMYEKRSNSPSASMAPRQHLGVSMQPGPLYHGHMDQPHRKEAVSVTTAVSTSKGCRDTEFYRQSLNMNNAAASSPIHTHHYVASGPAVKSLWRASAGEKPDSTRLSRRSLGVEPSSNCRSLPNTNDEWSRQASREPRHIQFIRDVALRRILDFDVERIDVEPTGAAAQDASGGDKRKSHVQSRQQHVANPSQQAQQVSGRASLLNATDCRDSSRKVVKIIKKSRLPASSGGDKLWRRLCHKLLRITAQHRGLMRISDIFETETDFHIVAERLEGGELFDFLLTERAVPEELCKYLIRQLLEAVQFLHSSHLLHRDLKPENVMFRRKRRTGPPPETPPGMDAAGAVPARPLTSLECSQTMSLTELQKQFELAIIDFDTCKMVDVPASEYPEVSNGRRRLVGTYGYLAPEVLKGHEYTATSDLWSIGVILYILMTGVPPVPMDQMVSAKSALQVLHEVRRQGIDFRLSPLPEFPQAQHLCRCLLEFEPSRRISSASAALQHSWLYPLASNAVPTVSALTFTPQHIPLPVASEPLDRWGHRSAAKSKSVMFSTPQREAASAADWRQTTNLRRNNLSDVTPPTPLSACPSSFSEAACTRGRTPETRLDYTENSGAARSRAKCRPGFKLAASKSQIKELEPWRHVSNDTWRQAGNVTNAIGRPKQSSEQQERKSSNHNTAALSVREATERERQQEQQPEWEKARNQKDARTTRNNVLISTTPLRTPSKASRSDKHSGRGNTQEQSRVALSGAAAFETYWLQKEVV